MLLPVYLDLIAALNAPPQAWPRATAAVLEFHRPYFEGLLQTYGPELTGPDGLGGALLRLGPALRSALAPAPSYQMELLAAGLLDRVAPLLPGRAPDLYLATLLFQAPAATIGVQGRPVIALGMERFQPAPRAGPDQPWFHPADLLEIIPHEAAHVARMELLGLPPSPRLLRLLDMLMLEGTAILFTDLLTGRQSLTSMLAAADLAWHRAHDRAVRTALLAEAGAVGMAPFLRYFAAGARPSGYYVGYSLCAEYLGRYGPGAMRELIGLPSARILERLSL